LDDYLNQPTYQKPMQDYMKHNVVIIGPPETGQIKVSKYLAREQKRGYVSLSDLIEWNK